jgi:hypothetical protein
MDGNYKLFKHVDDPRATFIYGLFAGVWKPMYKRSGFGPDTWRNWSSRVHIVKPEDMKRKLLDAGWYWEVTDLTEENLLAELFAELL